MFVGMFGYCMLTFAQPSLEEQKVKIERWKREFKSLDRQYVQNHVLHNGGGLVAKLSKKNHSRELARWRTLYEKTAAQCFCFHPILLLTLLGQPSSCGWLLWLTDHTSPPARVCAVKPTHGKDAAIFASFLFCALPLPRRGTE